MPSTAICLYWPLADRVGQPDGLGVVGQVAFVPAAAERELQGRDRQGTVDVLPAADDLLRRGVGVAEVTAVVALRAAQVAWVEQRRPGAPGEHRGGEWRDPRRHPGERSPGPDPLDSAGIAWHGRPGAERRGHGRLGA